MGSALTHQAGKTLKRSWNSDMRVDFDQNVLLGMDVDLQETGFVDRAVQQR